MNTWIETKSQVNTFVSILDENRKAEEVLYIRVGKIAQPGKYWFVSLENSFTTWSQLFGNTSFLNHFVRF